MPGITIEPQDDNSATITYIILSMLLTSFAATYAVARFAESHNRLDYDNRFARILAGSLLFLINIMHANKNDTEIFNGAHKLLAIGPHRTGWEAAIVASKMQGTPPQFYATTAYNNIPGVAAFLKMFKSIPIEPSNTKQVGRTANAKASDYAKEVLNTNGCVAIFPQGNFAKLGQDAPIIYPGIAKLALQNSIPIHVIRLDNFWCLQNALIPQFIRNNATYRAFLSFFHVNNIRTTMCDVIDFHLQPKNSLLSEEEKIEEISAQLYAYYRKTQDLPEEKIVAIKKQIAENTHHQFWSNRMSQYNLNKKLLALKEEESKLEQCALLGSS